MKILNTHRLIFDTLICQVPFIPLPAVNLASPRNELRLPLLSTIGFSTVASCRTAVYPYLLYLAEKEKTNA